MTLAERHDGPVLSRVDGATAFLTLNRPDRLNALDEATLDVLEACIHEAGLDPNVHAIVIASGTSRAFSAGADLKWLGAATDASDVASRSHRGHRTMNAVADCPKPTIAAIEGVAFGGGCELALACDYRIAGGTARFGQPEIKLGIIPGWGGTQRLARLIGPSRATDMILTGRPVNAEEAVRIGLANSVVGAGDALAAATSLANSFASAAPVAVKIAKAVIRRGMDMALGDGLATEIEGFVSSFATVDAREGVAAFLEKRPPSFSGH
ncbi:MAG: hypothetical protein EXR45_04115 [Chloroflexi bacterium]|nr:hypothetical protein [Chloroflexota bacterium]